MRHLASLIVGVVIGIVAWMLIGYSQAHLGALPVTGLGHPTWSAYQLPLLLMAIAGLLVGLVAATRISPAGPLVAGAGFVVLQLAYVASPGFLDWLPRSVFGQTRIWTRPAATGVAALLGLVMLVAILSVRRWQRWPGTTATATDTDRADRLSTGPRSDSSIADTDPTIPMPAHHTIDQDRPT